MAVTSDRDVASGHWITAFNDRPASDPSPAASASTDAVSRDRYWRRRYATIGSQSTMGFPAPATRSPLAGLALAGAVVAAVTPLLSRCGTSIPASRAARSTCWACSCWPRTGGCGSVSSPRVASAVALDYFHTHPEGALGVQDPADPSRSACWCLLRSSPA